MKYILISLLLFGCAKEGPKGSAGAQGPQGSLGPSGTQVSVVSATTFCPDIAGQFPEVGFVIDSKIYALYYDGSNPHLSLIPPGNYVTTDGRDCHFTIGPNNELL